jgi:hypothetical protein
MSAAGSRRRVFGALFLALLLVVSPAVTVAGAHTPRDSTAEARESISAVLEQPDTPARRGAERALDALESEGRSVSPALRDAALQGAADGTALAAGTVGTSLSAVRIRSAAYGAVYGALRRAATRHVDAGTVRSAVSGAVAGALGASGLASEQGGVLTPAQVLAGAQGGSEGAVAGATTLASEPRSRIGEGDVFRASLGGASGGVAAAGLLPVFGDPVAAANVYHASFGGAAGGLHGTAEALVVTDSGQPIEAAKTVAAAAGASGGAVSATLSAAPTDAQLSTAAYAVARETMGRAATLTEAQMVEFAITGSVDRLLRDEVGDAVFPASIHLPQYSLAVGPPRDPDDDGRYEDINGNRALSYADVVTLTIVMQGYFGGQVDLSSAQRAALDFNEDGVFDARDVRALDEEVTAETGDGAG